MRAMERNHNWEKRKMEEERRAMGILKGAIQEAIPVRSVSQYSIQAQPGGNYDLEVKRIDIDRGGEKVEP